MKNKDEFVDRHKVAAMISYSIIKAEPFFVIGTKGVKKTYFDFLPNEFLAVKCGIETLRHFGIFEAKDIRDRELFDLLIQRKFIFPICKENTFLDHLARALYNSKQTSHFDVFTYALVFFLIEEYTFVRHNITRSFPAT